MIISDFPRNIRAWRGLVLPVTLLLVWDVGVTVLDVNEATHFDGVDIQFTLFGTVIALFVGTGGELVTEAGPAGDGLDRPG